MANFNLWSSLSNFFVTSSGPVNGEYWALSNAGDGGNPIWVETYTPAATYSPGAVETYTIVMTTQDWVGTEQPLVTVDTDANIVDPFGDTSLSLGNLAAAEISSGNSTTGFGGILYWQDSTTVAGDYALEFVPITETYATAPTTGPGTVVSGSPVTVDAAIAKPTSDSFNAESTGIVYGYTTAVSSSTENLYLQGLTTSGSPDTAPVEVLGGVPDSTQWYIGYGSGGFSYRYTVVDGSATGLYGGTFDPTTGAVGAASEITSLPSFTSITGLSSRATLSNGDTLRFFEGVSSGQDILEAYYNNTTLSAAYDLTSANDRYAYADVYDPGNGQLDYTVLAYTDNNQVHLELLNAVGNQIGSDFIVPGITQFDRIHTLTGTSNNSDWRVELDYTVTDPSGGTEIEGLIYDTSTGPYVYTLGGSGNNEYNGSPFNDTISWAAGVYFVDGGGGSDTFSATNLSASQVTISVNPAGDVVVNDGKGDIDTLKRFTTIDLSNATVTISGNTLTETYGDGSRSVSTFNIPGQAYTSDVVSYAANGQIASVFFNGVTGDGYLSSYGYLYAGNSLVGTESIYSGNPSFSHEELDYNGAGQFVRGVFSGLSSSSPFSSFVETLVGGVYAGVSLIYTNVPAGTPYSSYDVNYSFTGALAGVDLFYTNLSGIGYTNLEEDLDPSGNIVRLVATGYTSGALYKTEYDYSGGVYEGDKTYYNITGQAYTQLEVDESASGQTEKVVYSGFSSGISSSELDYTNGVVTQGVVAYANVTGQNYNAFQVVENTAGTPLSDVLDLNSGGHMQTAFASGQTLTSQGDDTFTGDGATTFVLNPIYGSDTITNLNSADTVDLSSTEFANSSVLLGDASASGTSVIIKAADGDTLTLDNQTIASFTALSNNFVIH